jgi:hypothetical protein
MTIPCALLLFQFNCFRGPVRSEAVARHAIAWDTWPRQSGHDGGGMVSTMFRGVLSYCMESTVRAPFMSASLSDINHALLRSSICGRMAAMRDDRITPPPCRSWPSAAACQARLSRLWTYCWLFRLSTSAEEA